MKLRKTINDTLIFIPARSGSKGVKNKNVKDLNGKPLISYTLEFALKNFRKQDIYISTNCDKVIEIAKGYGLIVSEKRPEELCTDDSSIYESITHTINSFERKNIFYEKLIMLQPTTPIRKDSDLKEIINLYNSQYDAVISVVKSKSNPYFTLYEQKKNGYLKKSKKGNYYRRQDCPNVYEFNGSVFMFNINSLKKSYVSGFRKIKKFEMELDYSIDIDDWVDWEVADLLIKRLDKHE